MAGLILDPGPVVQRSDDAADRDRLAVHPIDSPADIALETSSRPGLTGGLDALGIIQHDDRAGGPLPEQLRQQDGAVPGRAAADVVAEVDQDDRTAIGRHRPPHRLLRPGTRDEQLASDVPHPPAQLVGDVLRKRASPSATAITEGPIAGVSA